MFGDESLSAAELSRRPRADRAAVSPPAGSRELALVLWRGKRWPLAFAALFVVLALLYSLLATPAYDANVQILVDPQDLRLLENNLTPSDRNGEAGVVIVESQARVMQSTSVLLDVVKRLDLANDPEFVAPPSIFDVGKLLSTLLGRSPPAGDPATLADNIALAALAKTVSVVRSERTYVIDVYTRSRDPVKAAAIANALAEAYFAYRENQRFAQADLASSSLEERLKKLMADLKRDEDAVEAFRAANEIVGTTAGLVVENQVADSNRSLSEARAEVSQTTVALEQLRALAANPDLSAAAPESLTSPDLIALRADLNTARAQESTLTATLGPRHPKVVEASQRVGDARAAIAAAIKRLMQGAELAHERALAEYRSLESSLRNLSGSLQTTNSTLVQLRQLERMAQASRAVYEEALLRARETREQAQLNPTNAQIISPARVPTEKTWPPRLSALLPFSAMLGALVGSGVTLGKTYLGFDFGIGSRLRGLRPVRRVKRRARRETVPAAAPVSTPVPAAVATLVAPEAPRQAGPEGSPPDRGVPAAVAPAAPREVQAAPPVTTRAAADVSPRAATARARPFPPVIIDLTGLPAEGRFGGSGRFAVPVMARRNTGYAGAVTEGLAAMLRLTKTGSAAPAMIAVMPVADVDGTSRVSDASATLALNLALAGIEGGLRTLLVDLDPRPDSLRSLASPEVREMRLGEADAPGRSVGAPSRAGRVVIGRQLVPFYDASDAPEFGLVRPGSGPFEAARQLLADPLLTRLELIIVSLPTAAAVARVPALSAGLFGVAPKDIGGGDLPGADGGPVLAGLIYV